MAARKQGVSDLLRKAGQDARKSLIQQQTAEGGTRSSSDGIFNILEYIESDWGLSMTLFPVQRAIVKLYYHIELDDTLPEEENRRIRIVDFLTGNVKYTLTEKEYLTYLFSEGRCNIGEQDHERRELLLSIGRRAGKCVVPDTLLRTNRGVVPLGSLGNVQGPEWQAISCKVDQEDSPQEATGFYAPGEQPTIRIRTGLGLQLEGTPTHRIKVLNREGLVTWRELGALESDDHPCIHRKATPLWPKSYVDVSKNHCLSIGRKDITLPHKFTEEWGELLGALVGDGTWGNAAAVSLTVGCPQAWSHFQQLYIQLFGSYRRQMKTAGVGRLDFCSKQARAFLHELGFDLKCGRDLKHIPWVIWKSPKTVVASFLRGLFETDGSAERGGRIISFSTSSPRLAHEVQILLLQLGVLSRVKARENKKLQKVYYHLTLQGYRSRKLFVDEVGFLTDRKRIPAEQAVLKDGTTKSGTESIPHQKGKLRQLLESVPKAKPGKGWTRSNLREAMGNLCKPSSKEQLTPTRLRLVLKVARDEGADQSLINHFEGLLDQDFFYDTIASQIPGRSVVCDLSVPEGERFIANGFVNHNSTLSGIFASYEVYRLLNLYSPQEYYGLPSNNRIQIISLATDKDQAGILFNEVAGHLAKCEYFKPYQASNTQTNVYFRTPYDIDKFGSQYRENGKFASFNGKASIRLTFRGASGKGTRGYGNIVVILDEFAHFLDTGPSSAAEMYKSITPSTAAFSPKDPEDPMTSIGPKESRIICISSPLGKSGKFYALYDQAMRNDKGSENMLAIQAPTWEVNPTVHLSDLQQAYYADPKAFSVEFGAEFNDTVGGWIEREDDLSACIDPAHRPILQARPRVPHFMGIDVGLVGDGTYICICHIENGKIVLDYHEGWYAGVDWRETNPHLQGRFSCDYAKRLKEAERLDFEEISNWIIGMTKKFSIRDGLFDSWNGIPLEQALHKRGLKQFQSEHFTRDASSKIYQSAKMMMFDEKLVLYDTPVPEQNEDSGGGSRHSPYIAELLSLRAKKVSKNITIVEAPQKEGAHDDFSDALVRSIWLAVRRMGDEKYASHGRAQGRPHVSTGSALKTHQLRKMRNHGMPPRRAPGRGRR